MDVVERGCLPKANCAGLPISECEERHKKLVEDNGGKVCSCPRTNDGSTVLVCACATPKCNDLSARRPNINDCMNAGAITVPAVEEPLLSWPLHQPFIMLALKFD